MADPFAELVARVAELERRAANLMRHGTVKEVDAAKQLVRLQLGGSGEAEFIGPWVPYSQIAGALKVHTPPSVGQQMTMFNPNGDFRQAVALPMTWSDQNASPSDKGDEHVVTIGDFKATLKGDSLVVSLGGSTIRVTADEIKTTSQTVAIEGQSVPITGDGLTHNGHSVGDDHVHQGVTPGSSNTGPPP